MLHICQQLASTVQNVEQSPLLLVTQAADCHCAQLNALFCCLWCNVEASCHKHFVVFSRNQHRRLPPAMCHNLRDGSRGPPATVLTTKACCSVHSRQIKAQNCDFCLPHLHLTPPLGGFASECRHPVQCVKTRMVWLPDGEKISNIFIRFDRKYERDRQTDRQTVHIRTHKCTDTA